MESIVSERRNVFYHNLLCLDATNDHFLKKYGVPIHSNMFAAPNRAGFEAVTHFLFTVLSGITHENYSLSWPLLDPECRRNFQKACYAHLTKFSEEGIVKFPRLTPSTLSTYGGERFIEIFLAFSTYVLVKKLKKSGAKFLNRPTASKESFQAVKNVMEASTITHVANFKETQIITHACLGNWFKISKNLSQCLEELKRLLLLTKDRSETDLEALNEILNLSPEETLRPENILKIIFEFQRKPSRAKMEKFFGKEKQLWQYVDSVVGSDSHEEVLDFGDLNLDQLNKNSELSCAGQDVELTVIKYMKMLLECLKSLTSGLEGADLGNLHEDCSVQNASEMKECYDNVVKVLERLMNVDLPSIKENIETLKKTVGFDDIPSTSNNVTSFPEILPRVYSRESILARVTGFEPGELLSSALSSSDSFPKCFE